MERALAPAAPRSRTRGVDDLAGILRMVAIVAAALVVNLVGVTYVQHTATQQRLYKELRQSLAEGSVPVSQVRTVDTETVPGSEDAAGAPATGAAAAGAEEADGQSKVELVPPGTPVALLEMPTIDRKLVVVEGTASRQTAQGPGHLRTSALPGQEGVSVLMGHAALYGGDFYSLPSLKTGDKIVVTTGQGRFTYAVTAHREAGDPLPAVVKPGQSRLTLTTASGAAYAPDGVLRVDAELVGKKALARPATVLTPASIATSEQAMGKDLSGLLPAIFLLQLLLIAIVGVMWLWYRWGRLQTWIVGVPVIVALSVALGSQLNYYLPNIL